MTNKKAIIDKLIQSYWMEIETVINYISNSINLDGVRADITGRFRSAEINKKIGVYVSKFVNCPECGKPDTKLVKANRLTTMTCMACGSKKPVRSLK